ncbi:MAG: hypothetical protein HUK12_10390 [Muribaculaceae bacterium]|nr:hypothetical protein [Muribaculaceae bacterium]
MSWDALSEREKYDLEGNVVEDFVVCVVKPLQYDSNEYSNDGSIIYKKALCYEYYIGYNQYGLMTPSGKPITPAIYTNIQAISKDRFLCGIGLNEYVILDNSGQKVTK